MKVGDKVVCVDNSYIRSTLHPNLKFGRVYTIKSIGEPYLTLKEIAPAQYRIDRFRPATELDLTQAELEELGGGEIV